MNALFQAAGVDPADSKAVAAFAQRAGLPVQRLRYYDENRLLPSGGDLESICTAAVITPLDLMLRMGRLDHATISLIQRHADAVAAVLRSDINVSKAAPQRAPSFSTTLGSLYQGDCIDVLCAMESESVDLVFADPPFNLKKLYPSGIDDDLKEEQYVAWCERWLSECIRVLAPGGSLFLWNIPRWNSLFAGYLNGRLTFRHWIGVDIKYSLPVAGRLYPSHYSLLYYCKGPKPNKFHPDRLPMQVCPECKADLKDYGGYKDKMNPGGVNLTDIWYDIPPVRHSKYKKRNGANELSIKLLDRILEMASDPGDLVLDPFGGSGTTYAVAEMKQRRWVGVEIGPVDEIVARLKDLKKEREYLEAIRRGYNRLFTAETAAVRRRQGRWTDATFAANGNGNGSRPAAYAIPTGQGVLELREQRRRYGRKHTSEEDDSGK